MNKKESLAFLQSCIDNINNATSEEIALFQEVYDLNCSELMVSSNFEFIPPINISGCLYETNEIKQLKFSEAEYETTSNSIQWNYNLGGICTSNEQSGKNLAYAA